MDINKRIWRAMLIVLVLIVLSTVLGVVLTNNPGEGYYNDKEIIYLDMLGYVVWGPLPTTGEQITIDKGTLNVIDICQMEWSLGGVPASCADATHDNCEAGSCACNPDGHYIWLVDSNGDIYSTCVGSKCGANNEDGFQGVYP